VAQTYFDGNLLFIHHLNGTEAFESLFLYNVPAVDSNVAA